MSKEMLKKIKSQGLVGVNKVLWEMPKSELKVKFEKPTKVLCYRIFETDGASDREIRSEKRIFFEENIEALVVKMEVYGNTLRAYFQVAIFHEDHYSYWEFDMPDDVAERRFGQTYKWVKDKVFAIALDEDEEMQQVRSESYGDGYGGYS